MTIKLERIQPRDLTPRDIQWIIMSCLRSFDGATATEVVDAAMLGQVGIHRIIGDAEGIVVLEAQVLRKRPGLKIIGLAGKNLLKNFEEVHEAICTVAKGYGGLFVSGFVGRGALADMYKRKTAAKHVASVFVEDLK